MAQEEIQRSMELQGSKETSISETTFEELKKEELASSKISGQPAMASATAASKDEPIPTIPEKKNALDDEAEMEYPQGVKLWVILGALCLAVFLVALDQTIISTAV